MTTDRIFDSYQEYTIATDDAISARGTVILEQCIIQLLLSVFEKKLSCSFIEKHLPSRWYILLRRDVVMQRIVWLIILWQTRMILETYLLPFVQTITFNLYSTDFLPLLRT